MTGQENVVRALFAGYARVHYLSFEPIYRRLADDPRIEWWFTGGHPVGPNPGADGDSYDLDGFYDGFGLPADRIIPYAAAREQSFNLLFCAHLSRTMTPRHADVRIQLFHGVSFKNAAVTAKALEYDYLFLAGPYMRRRFVDLGLFAPDDPRLVTTGFAKMDRLVDGTLSRATTLESLGLDPRRRTILFAPTGERGNALELYGDSVIGALCDLDDCNLVLKPHDHPEDKSFDWPSILGRHESDRVRAVFDPDIVPLLHASDLLVTDASSVANEFTLLDRPIVFLDVPEMLEELERRGVPLDLQTWGRGGGVTIGEPERLPAVIRGLLEGGADDRGEIRREIAADVFHRPGTATDRCVATIDEILSTLRAGTWRSGPILLTGSVW